MNKCECGCGQQTPIYKCHAPKRGYVKGQPSRFIRGHHKGNKGNYKENPRERAFHERALAIIKGKPCAINDEHCKGKIDAHHIDKNIENNDPKNVVPVCRSHHRLMDKRNLTVKQLKNNPPEYRVDPAGKRRYKK
jgi:hypothetical protein